MSSTDDCSMVTSRRHFGGEIEAVAELGGASAAWTFVRDPGRSGYVRRRREQMRIVPLTDAPHDQDPAARDQGG
jgi:hypothetical protein